MSCYELLQIDENTCSYEIRDAYLKLSADVSDPRQLEQLFEAYTLALELCMYKPFFEKPCDFEVTRESFSPKEAAS